MYEVKNVKSCASRNGLATSCTIYKQGIKIGEMIDAGEGGMVNFHMAEQDLEELRDHAKKELNSTYDYAHEIFLATLCDDYDMTKKARRSKTKTFFKLITDGEEDIYTIPYSYTENIERQLKAKYGENLIKVYS